MIISEFQFEMREKHPDLLLFFSLYKYTKLSFQYLYFFKSVQSHLEICVAYLQLPGGSSTI